MQKNIKVEVGMQLDDFGRRLREERERLGLSQEAFGAIGGVKKLAQLKYEKGERAPDANYLAAIKKRGVDISFLLTGDRNEEAERFAFHDLLLLIGARLGIDSEVMEKLMFQAWQDEERNMLGEALEEVNVSRLLDDVWKKLPKPEVDCRTLEAVLEGIESTLERKGKQLQPRNKSSMVSMFYQSARDTGKVDLKMIEYAVSLATD